VAGLATGWRRGLSVPETVRLASACGAANFEADLPGMIDSARVSALMSEVSIEPLKCRVSAERSA
jgi:fructose-1-phosphate kinase PfkB-like protein